MTSKLRIAPEGERELAGSPVFHKVKGGYLVIHLHAALNWNFVM